MGVFSVEAKDSAYNFAWSEIIFNQINENSIFAKPRSSKLRKLKERNGGLDGEPGDGGRSIEDVFVKGAWGTSCTAIKAGFEVVLRRKVGGGDSFVVVIVESDGGLVGLSVEHELLKKQW